MKPFWFRSGFRSSEDCEKARGSWVPALFLLVVMVVILAAILRG